LEIIRTRKPLLLCYITLAEERPRRTDGAEAGFPKKMSSNINSVY
jgi:hypothetical protein